MPHVSIRESEGCDLVEELTGKRPLHVLDPVFLLTADEWREIAKKPTWLNKKKYERGYVITYFFKGNPPGQIKALADKLGLPVINLYSLNNFDHYVTGVEEFLYLFDHATLICSQSFHASAFSIIFKRPFITYRTGSVITGRFSRLQSLLDLFGLNERATDLKLNLNVADPLMVDFSRRDEMLPRERFKAFRFLARSLGTAPREKISEVTHDED